MPQTSSIPVNFDELAEHFFTKGWCRFPFDPQLATWVAEARPQACTTVNDPEFAVWLRYGGTWFAGVNALANDTDGRVDTNGSALIGMAIDFIARKLGLEVGRDFAWDRGQVSVCYPGYPQPMDGETDGAFRYRVKRDAAHLDGLHPVGAERRRHLNETHAFILGIPLTEADENASPLIVWDGSHEMIREAMLHCYEDVAPEHWVDLDVTDAYQTVRREIFKSCPRTIVQARPGECYLVHRLALHGVAPWGEDAKAEEDGRMIVYFRPELIAGEKQSSASWLHAP